VSRIGTTISALDFGLRVAFFAVAPCCLAFAALLFPVSGALLQIGLALVVLLAGELPRTLASRSRLAQLLLSSQLAFHAYYREHPPRPFLYYVFYPLLFPYWLWVRDARREFWLYRGYTLPSFLLLLASLGINYLRAFPPELGLPEFAPLALGTLLVEAVVVLMLLMPLVTTVVHYHARRAGFRLAALLIVGGLSVTVAVCLVERRRDPVVSFATRARVRLRTKAQPSLAYQTQLGALGAAWRVLPRGSLDVDRDGKVEGLPLEQAHTALATFYKRDEAQAFDLWLSRERRRAVLVIYFEARRGHGPIFLAVDQSGRAIREPEELPSGAFAAMRRAASK
jgi:hypothetical protein